LGLNEIKGIHLVLEIYQTLILTTNECERAFSCYKNIHTEIRSSLNIATIDDVMNVHVNGPDLAIFNFNASIENWKNRRARTYINFKV